MPFIILLALSTLAIAGSAAFFSVYGLATTLSGVFWSVVVMGASLEAGKLIAASYLYRYWDKTQIVLKSYMVAGVLVLMVVTSWGIFGYLSSGYQQDILPLQQKKEQIKLLQQEKDRDLLRKRQIDDLIAGGPIVQTIQKGENIDPNAIHAMREIRRSRTSVVNQYKEEQKNVTTRIGELDTQLLTLKQQQIMTEAHIGPIIYVAKALGLSTDDATKYLIFMIMFAFDPMAVALTLAVNVALRVRKEEQDKEQQTKVGSTLDPTFDIDKFIKSQKPLDPKMAKIINDNLWDLYEHTEMPPPVVEPDIIDEPVVTEPEPIVEPILEVVEESVVEPAVEQEIKQEPVVEPLPSPNSAALSRIRPFAALWKSQPSATQISTILDRYHQLNEKKRTNPNFTVEDMWEKGAIEEVLRNHGFSQYLTD